MKKDNFMRYFYISLTGAGAIIISISFFFLLFRADQVFHGIGRFTNIMMPFIYGAVIAYLLTPICNRIEQFVKKVLGKHWKNAKGVERTAGMLGIAVSLTVALLTVYFLLSLVLPQIFQSVRGIVILLPSNIEKWTLWLESYVSDNEVLLSYVEQFSEEVNNYVQNFLRNYLLPNMQMIVSGLSSSVLNLLIVLKNIVLGVVAAVYMMGNRKKFAAQAKKFIYSILKVKHANGFLRDVQRVDKIFGGFIAGKLLDSLIIGCICFVCTSVMKMPYAMLVSVIVGVTNVIPFFGPYIGAIPSALLILMISPMKCLYFLIFILALQQFDGNILGPKILGEYTDLSGFWVFFSILVFGGLFGFVGMLVGVPTFAVIYQLLKRWMERLLKKKNLSMNTDDYIDLDSVNTEQGMQYIYNGEGAEKSEKTKAQEPEEEEKKDDPCD